MIKIASLSNSYGTKRLPARGTSSLRRPIIIGKASGMTAAVPAPN